MTANKNRELLAGAARAASYNMVLQLLMRVLTFILNAVVIRFVTKDLLGVVNVRLMLLVTTTMFIVNVPFEKAALTKTEHRNWQQTINLLWLQLPFAIICSCFFGTVWYYAFEPPDPEVVPFYGVGVILFSCVAVIESSAQPLNIIATICLFLRLRVIVLGISQLVRCVLTVLLLIFIPKLGLINFAISQVVCSLVYAISYFAYFAVYTKHKKKDDDFHFNSLREVLPRKIPDKPFIDKGAVGLAWSFFKQSILKQMLTEGERYVMTIFDVLSFADQGIYDIVSNLGSMAARFVFMPIEESGYLFFSQSLIRGDPLEKQSKESQSLIPQVLHNLIKLVSLIGVLILVFGYAYSFLALDMYGGQILSSGSGPLLLRWFCIYVLLLAVNGITECFVFATMSKDQVDRYNHKMLAFSFLFLLSSLAFTYMFGSVGFILANCLNMICRILHSIYFISIYFQHQQENPLSKCWPRKTVIISLFVSFFITASSEKLFCCDNGWSWRFVHIFIGGLCFGSCLLAIYIKEIKLIKFVQEKLLTRTNRSQNPSG